MNRLKELDSAIRTEKDLRAKTKVRFPTTEVYDRCSCFPTC